MIELTQSDTVHGNCWQTAVACMVERPAEELPPQVEVEQWDHEVLLGWGHYHNVINGYLSKHHRKVYVEMPYWEAYGLGVFQRLPYLLSGPTTRTAIHAASGRYHVHHVVVGRPDQTWWDPHPSRAGLLRAEEAGVLIEEHEDKREQDREWLSKAEGIKREVRSKVFHECLCPACNLDWARGRALAIAAAKGAEKCD